ncbi:hypothetical protein PHYPSEUDO_006439 [Phytophthora pseudosyringae]|uniref:Uncharacterized protein n=1 Tax=Phytophthora pseudosyringae TaxID=221518 RepID=A0A8T1VM45_9STRA|nr:hypothetical protein PHYPSEUDO_006439 [Phytophthora pseudosyringae]
MLPIFEMDAVYSAYNSDYKQRKHDLLWMMQRLETFMELSEITTDMIRGRKWYLMDYIYENSNYLNHHGKNRRCNPNGTTRQFPSADFVDKDKLEKMKELIATRNPRQVAPESNSEPTECVKDKVKLVKVNFPKKRQPTHSHTIGLQNYCRVTEAHRRRAAQYLLPRDSQRVHQGHWTTSILVAATARTTRRGKWLFSS